MSTKPRIFMLEDSELIAALVRDAIEAKDWQVKICGMAAEALDAARKFAPDIILLDVNLPDGNGFDVCRQMRRDPALAKTPVIFMTSKGDIPSRLKGFEAGAQDYVAKPFVIEEMLARIRAHLDIKGRIDSLTREKEDLALRDRTREDMMDMVVHDLRTPLSSIKMTLDMLDKSALIANTRYGMFLGNAEYATEFALLMVNDFLDERAGSIRIELGAVDLPAIFARLTSLFSPMLAMHQVQLRAAVPAKLPPIVSDGTLILRILANLLGNSIKFSPKDQIVILRVEPHPGRIRLVVSDKGPGIPDSEKTKIFDKFYRASNTKSRMAPGYGIGLAFCHLAAVQLNGRIWVEDVPDGGSCFLFEFPSVA